MDQASFYLKSDFVKATSTSEYFLVLLVLNTFALSG
jgi:hypothetical protein